MKYDVIISGAGPSGTTLAYHLAGAGLEVLVLEKQVMPRDKPCGGGVTYKSARLLEFPWQETIEDTIHTVVFNYRDRSGVTIRPALPVAYMVTRSNFDRLLAERARSAGALIIEGTAVTEVAVENGQVSVCAGGKTHRGRIFAGADGANGKSARLLGLYHPKETGPSLEAELECPPDILERYRGVIRVDCGAAPWGYGWVFPKKDHLSTGVATFIRRSKGLRRLLNDFLAREGLGAARVLSVSGFPIPSGGVRRKIYNKSAMLLGDAAGLVDPFCGEGIYYALKSAHLAAETILDNRKSMERAPAVYQELVDAQITAELAITRKLAKVFYTFPGVAFSLIEKTPDIAGTLCRIICGEDSYSGLKGAAAQVIRALYSQSGRPRFGLQPSGVKDKKFV